MSCWCSRVDSAGFEACIVGQRFLVRRKGLPRRVAAVWKDVVLSSQSHISIVRVERILTPLWHR